MCSRVEFYVRGRVFDFLSQMEFHRIDGKFLSLRTVKVEKLLILSESLE